jgi:hypothetical protein
MSAPPDPDGTVSNTLQDGLLLAHRAQDGGDWKAVVDWLVRNPSHAPEAISCLAAERGIRPLIAPLRVPASLTSVGRYELRGVLGSGAMGVVYQAFDPNMKREVAVKLLHPDGELSADDRARFRFEAEAMGSLTHDHVVRVYDFGEADGVPFLVMPLLTGGTLAGWLKGRGRQLPPKEAAGIARDIALGVHHAHQRGIIHRDLKPANILRDDAGSVRVADFGLARLADATTSRMAGTVAYMAPEQVGSGQRLTTAVDVHAVGAILFELLAGGPPFGGTDVGSVLDKVKNAAAPAVRLHRPDVPRDLEAIVAKCLEKRAEDRYPSALALADDLDNFIHDRPVTAAPRSVLTDVVRAVRYSTPPEVLYGWRALLIGGLSCAACYAVLQTAVLLNAPKWVEWACAAYYLTSWVAVWGWTNTFRRKQMKPVERELSTDHLGMMIGSIALAAIQLCRSDGDFIPVLPSFLVVIGVGTFCGGSTFSGRMFLEGVVLMLAGVGLPLLPARFWPAAYGAFMAAMMLWYAVLLYARGKRADAPYPPLTVTRCEQFLGGRTPPASAVRPEDRHAVCHTR